MAENETIKEEFYDVEVVDADEIDESVEGEVVTGTYTTGDVAKATGVSREMVRYYIKYFSEFLSVQETEGRHKRINEEDFELLKFIAQQGKSGKKVAEIRGILKDENMRILFAGKSETEQIILNLLTENNKQLISTLCQLLGENQEKQNSLLLEERTRLDSDKKKMLEEIEELKEQINKQNDLFKQKEEENAKYNAQLREQVEKQNELLEKIVEQTANNSKKRFLWW